MGKQVKLFLADGTPGELVTAEITNWTGHVVAAPRSKLAALLEREEARRTGAYLLLGDDPDAVGGVRCYVGEGDEIRTRLKEHASSRGKDFWTRVVIITSKDANLTKAHGRHLESRLVSMAAAAARCTLDNSTAPPPSGLPEADVSDMDYFLQQLQIVLPVLGVNILRGRDAAALESSSGLAVTAQSASPEFELRVKKHGIEAHAQQIDGEFTVLAGSLASAAFSESKSHADSTAAAYAGYAKLHSKLREDGSLLPQGALLVFTRDVVFASSSAAGAIVTGRSCNGRTSWKTVDGVTFGDWEQRGIQ